MSSRAPIGHLGIAGVPLCTNQGCKSFVPGPLVDSKFLYFALLREVPRLKDLGSGATFAEVSKSAMENYRIPLPPLQDQERVAEQLSCQLTLVERARSAVIDQVACADQLQPAILREAFHGITPLTSDQTADPAPAGWKWVPLGKLARLESGHTPSRKHPEYWGGNVPWIALPDIRALDGKTAFETSEYTNDAGIKNSSARILPAHTVVLCRTGSVGLVTIMGRPMATSQGFANWVCGPDLEPWFLLYLLMRARGYLHRIADGALVQDIYMHKIKSLRVCVPDVDQQRRLVARVRGQLAAAGRGGRSARAILDELEHLPQVLLRRVFNGGI